jgi:hypothetical protein
VDDRVQQVAEGASFRLEERSHKPRVISQAKHARLAGFVVCDENEIGIAEYFGEVAVDSVVAVELFLRFMDAAAQDVRDETGRCQTIAER